jgi:hypothetical protein
VVFIFFFIRRLLPKEYDVTNIKTGIPFLCEASLEETRNGIPPD